MKNSINTDCHEDGQHQWGWASVTSFVGGRSGLYAKCRLCHAEDWTILDTLRAEMPPVRFKPGDRVTYRDERWRYDIEGNTRLDLVKVNEYDAIIKNSFDNPDIFGREDFKRLTRRYSIACLGKDGEIFERTPTEEFLTPSDHDGTVAEWHARQPKPHVLEDNDPVFTEPRLRSIGITFQEHRDAYRCCHCSRIQSKGTPIAYVRDGIRVGDDWRALVRQYKRDKWNAHSSGWCPKCAHKLLPMWSKAYLKLKFTGHVPMAKYIQSTCDTCHKQVNSYYYRSIGEDQWEVFCRECQYAKQSHDMYEGGFGHMLGSSATYVGAVQPGESISIAV